MGNCCKTASSSVDWAGDDWGSLTSKHGKTTSCLTRSSKVFDEGQFFHSLKDDDVVLEEEEDVKKQLVSGLLMGGNNNYWNACNIGKGNKKVVKIRISKKELQEMLEIENKNNKKKHEGIANRDCAEHVLVRLLNDHYHHHWRPVLQTIPEIN